MARGHRACAWAKEKMEESNGASAVDDTFCIRGWQGEYLKIQRSRRMGTREKLGESMIVEGNMRNMSTIVCCWMTGTVPSGSWVLFQQILDTWPHQGGARGRGEVGWGPWRTGSSGPGKRPGAKGYPRGARPPTAERGGWAALCYYYFFNLVNISFVLIDFWT